MKRSKIKLLEDIDSKVSPLIKKLNTVSIRKRQDSFELSVLHDTLADVLDLYKEIHVDIYMYNVSMENYKNPELFLGHYYTDYALTKMNMLWERLIYFLGVFYNVEFDEKAENNTLKTVYDKLKAKNLKDPLSELLQKLFGTYGQIKQERNNNEHDLTVHLAENLVKENLNEKYEYEYNDEGVPFLSDEVYKEFVDETNFLVRKNKKKTIKALEKSLSVSWELMNYCLKIYENDIIENRVSIKIINKGLFAYDYDEEISKQLQSLLDNNVNLCIEVTELLNKSMSLRERVKVIADTINKNPILVFKRPPTIQILEYNIDISYRLVEYVRSLTIELALLNNQESKLINSNITNWKYYHNNALLRLYSMFEKIAKLLYTRFELSDYQGEKKELKNKYLSKIIKIAENEEMIDILPMKLLSEIASSNTYSIYEQIRNKAYHGIRPEFVIKGEELSHFNLYTLSIMIDLLRQLIDLLEIIEFGEENNLEMSKMIRDSQLKMLKKDK